MNHPSDERLHAFATGSLDEAGREAVELHLDACSECLTVMGQLLEGAIEAPGRRLGPFVLEALVGHGAMGAVYRARDTRLERIVALKLPRAEGPAAVERLLVEARAQARVQHPNVIGLYEAALFEGRLALVLEWCDGVTLRQWQAGRAASDILRAYLEAAAGLAAAHARGIVHRDFKPDNVVVDRAGRVRVTDFGLASGVTEAQGRAGTPAYMAPETWREGRCDAGSDQYAFALALLEALSGTRRQAAGLRALSRPLAAVLATALAEPPEARWASMEALRGALAAASARPALSRVLAAAALAVATAAVTVSLALAPGSCDDLLERAVRLERSLPASMRGVVAPGARFEGLSRAACAAPAVHACLERVLDEVEALSLVGGEPALDAGLLEAAQRLTDPGSCLARPVAEAPEPRTVELAEARGLVMRSEVLRRAGQEAGALRAADDAVRLASGGQGTLARAVVARGRALASLGQPDGAVEALREAERLAVVARADGTRLEAQLAQVMELCRGLGVTARCAEALRRAEDSAVDPPPAMRLELLELGATVLGQQARTLEAQGRYEEACAGWATQPGRRSELERCQLSLAINSETAGRLDRAQALAREVVRSARAQNADARLARALRLEASVSLAMGEVEVARQALEEADTLTLATGQDRARLEALRAQLLEATGGWPEALEAQRRALALAGDRHRGWARKQRLQLATWLAEAGQAAEAAEHFEALAAEVPDWQVRSDSDTFFGVQAMAWLAQRRGEADEAARLADWVVASARAHSTAPRYLVPVMAWRTERLVEAGRWQDAAREVEALEHALGGLVGAGPALTAWPRLLRARLLATSDSAGAAHRASVLAQELKSRSLQGRLAVEAAAWALAWTPGAACRHVLEGQPALTRVDGLAAGKALASAARACGVRRAPVASAR